MVLWFKSKDGVKIYYKIDRKRGKPYLLFLHGLAGDSSEFYYLVNELGNRFSTIIVDFRGHGKSSRPKGEYYSLDLFVSDVVSILKRHRIRKVSIIGFSMGAYIGIKVADFVKVDKFFMINPFLGPSHVRLFFRVMEQLSLLVPRPLLRLIVKDDKLYHYNGLFRTYAKMLLKTPMHVYHSIVKSLKDVDEVNYERSCFVIKSNFDEILDNRIGLNNAKIVFVNGFHYVVVQKYKSVLFVINSLL